MPDLSSEKELEDYLYSIDMKDCEDHPAGCEGKCFRQVEIAGCGIIDLLYIDVVLDYDNQPPNKAFPCFSVKIVELKRGAIDFNAVGQISRYKVSLERYIKNRTNTRRKLQFSISGILIGKEYDTGDVCFVVDSLEWLTCSFYKIDIKSGITFEHQQGYHMARENYKNLDKLTKDLLPEYLSQLRGYRKYLNRRRGKHE